MKCLVVWGLLAGVAAPAFSQGVPVAVPDCDDNGPSDTDSDSISDECEFSLARTFAPVLVVRSGGCNWNATLEPGMLDGGYFFAVQAADSAVRIAYLPAYFRDCGWRGVKCWLPRVNCASHSGDSEFMVVEVRRASGKHWRPTRLFLSAHCFGRSQESCRWYAEGALADFEWSGAAPVIWVAEGRNANYPSQQACDRGHYSLDTCDHNDTRYTFPVRPDRNIGSRSKPLGTDGCVFGRDLGTRAVAPNVTECFWRSGISFRGWQSTGTGATGYWRYLGDIAGF
jgi:hypothetical protein